jgi:hypothetical protein
MTILAIALTFLLFADADVPRINSLRQPANPADAFPAGEELPPSWTSWSDSPAPTVPQAQQKQQDNGPNVPSVGKAGPLQESSKLELIRYVSGEFARAIKPLPAGKDGFIVRIGQPLDANMLDRQVATHGAAVNTGDHVQITKLEFHDKQIVVDLNGGGRGKKRLRDRIHLEMGGIPTARTTSTQQDQGPAGLQPGLGSTLFLEFPQPLPDLAPEDLKKILSPFLDFTRQRSASVQWFDTLPIEMKKAIQDRRPVVGMDREEVVAAIGKPEHKVRERDQDGNDIEDWIYGKPPAKTTFVSFQGDKVIRVTQYP